MAKLWKEKNIDTFPQPYRFQWVVWVLYFIQNCEKRIFCQKWKKFLFKIKDIHFIGKIGSYFIYYHNTSTYLMFFIKSTSYNIVIWNKSNTQYIHKLFCITLHVYSVSYYTIHIRVSNSWYISMWIV